jgi:hypothetical protein
MPGIGAGSCHFSMLKSAQAVRAANFEGKCCRIDCRVSISAPCEKTALTKRKPYFPDDAGRDLHQSRATQL